MNFSNTGGVTDMSYMFTVRSAARTLPPEPSMQLRVLSVRAALAPAAAPHAP